MHNESNADRTEPKVVEESESTQPSKLRRFASTAVKVGAVTVPPALSIGLTIVSFKTTKMDFATAKMNRELTDQLKTLVNAAASK